MLYKLSEEEIKVALAEASRRQSLNEAKGLKGRNGGAETGERALFFHQVGCLGEMAVASYLGLKDALFQESDAVRGSFDLPFCIDVKTRTKHYYDLIVQLDEEPGKNYWLVTIQSKTIRIHGWIEHDQCTKPEYVKDPAKNRSAYFVPQNALKSPESFRAEVMDKQPQAKETRHLDWAAIFERRRDLAPPGYEQAVQAGQERSKARYERIGKRRAGKSGKSKPGRFPGLKHGAD